MICRCCTGLPKFPYLAPYNAMMVKVQKPGSAFVVTLDTWQKVYHRRPKPGARPLVILRRFGPISKVFKKSQHYPCIVSIYCVFWNFRKKYYV